MLQKTEDALEILFGENIPDGLPAMVTVVEQIIHRRLQKQISLEGIAICAAICGVDVPEPDVVEVEREPDIQPAEVMDLEMWEVVEPDSEVRVEWEGGIRGGAFLGAESGKNKGKLRVKVAGDKAAHRLIPYDKVFQV